MSKVFITGIAGFLGSHVADEFIKNGHEVAGNDNLIGGYEDNIPKDAAFYPIDCRSGYSNYLSPIYLYILLQQHTKG